MKNLFSSWKVYMATVVSMPVLLIAWVVYLDVFTDFFDGPAGLAIVGFVGPILWTTVLLLISLLLSWVWRNRPGAKRKYVHIFWIIVGCLVMLAVLNSMWSSHLNSNYSRNLAERRVLVVEALQPCTVTEMRDKPGGGLYIDYSDRPTFVMDGWVMTSDFYDEIEAYDARCPTPLNLGGE